MCHRPSFPGNWLHPSSRRTEEDEVICTHCDTRVPVEFLVPSPPGQPQWVVRSPFVVHADEHNWQRSHDPPPFSYHGYQYPNTLEQSFADLYVSKSLSDQQLLRVARKLGSEWESLAIHMGFRPADLYRFKRDHRDSTLNQIFAMLAAWKEREGRGATKEKLKRALVEAEVDIDVMSCLDERESSLVERYYPADDADSD